MTKCKYFDDLGLKPEEYSTNFVADNDKRSEYFSKQRELYGFDERETWCLNIMFVEWIYSRCKMYLEVTTDFVNLSHHTIYHKGISYTQEEGINKILTLAEEILKDKFEDDLKVYNNTKEICELWTELIPHMWW